MRVLVTGAGKGIGRAIAIELADVAKSMILVSRNEESLLQVANEVGARNSQCSVEVLPMDITEEDNVRRLCEGISSGGDGLDVLVNCAGYAIPEASVQETPLEEWSRIFAVNVTAPYLLTKHLIPLLRAAPQPCIVNIGSTAGSSSRPGWSAYAASKAALMSFSNTMADELKPDGITVHCLAPGRTATELRRVLAPDEDPSTIMQPETVARIVRFLVSEEGRFLQGQSIVVRGDS